MSHGRLLKPGWYWLIGGGIVTVLPLAWVLASSSPREPVYQGRLLSDWLKGYPKEYGPVVRALGTNAVPFLLAELQTRDLTIAQLAGKTLAKASMRPFWSTARERRYRAGIALQILDTNAAPALMDVIFAHSMRMVEGDPIYSAASSLNWLSTPAAQEEVRKRLNRELSSASAARRRNACLAFSLWPHLDNEAAGKLAALTADTNSSVRAAAVRALIFNQSTEDGILPALIERLEDEHATIRRLTIEALRVRGKKAEPALPALRAAYSAELSRVGPRNGLEDGYFGPRSWSAWEIRRAIRDVVEAIDPEVPPPSDESQP